MPTVRIYRGAVWEKAEEWAKYEFETLPRVGEQLVFSMENGWRLGRVIAVAHRFLDPAKPADVGILWNDRMVQGWHGREGFPLSLLDGA